MEDKDLINSIHGVIVYYKKCVLFEKVPESTTRAKVTIVKP